jgi:hypothetical protein
LPHGKLQMLIKRSELLVDVPADALTHAPKLLCLGCRLRSEGKLLQALHRKLSKVIGI